MAPPGSRPAESGWFGGLSARIDIKRDVVALSLARLGDAIGNSLLFVVIPQRSAARHSAGCCCRYRSAGYRIAEGDGPLLGGFLVGYFFALPFIVAAALCVFGAWVVYQFTPETVHRGHPGASRP